MTPSDLQNATREVFGNIAPWMRATFYAMIYGSIAVLAWQIFARFRLWKQGQPGGFERDWHVWMRRIVIYAVAQKRVHRKSLGAVLHVLLFSGFVVLTIGTTLLAIADQGPINFHRGWYFLFYELTMDIFGVALCVGCGLAFYRRIFRRKPSLGHTWRDWALLGSLLALGVTGFLVEAFRIHYTSVPQNIARWSIIGSAIESVFLQSVSVTATQKLHLWSWWVHAILVAVFFACIPVTRFLHVITGPINIAARPERPTGALEPLVLEQVEKSGRIGVSRIEHFNRQQLLSLDACMECGRCEDACPAWASGKPLSPKQVIVNLRGALPGGNQREQPLQADTVRPETLWSCTMCQACVKECPVLIGHVDIISDMRRFLVSEGQIVGSPAKAMAAIGRQFNPYGRPPADRMAWAQGLKVPTVEENPNFEYLLWIGCAPAFDPRAQKIARATVQLLQDANVSFAVLGKEEKCTGDTARRLGDEFLFQELATANIETLNRRKVKKIITPCPHCFNTLKSEYSQFGGHYEVRHHSQILADLAANNKLNQPAGSDDPITLHDPCYLARANDEVAAPRAALSAPAGCGVREMPRNGKKTFCCGAGGGRMWFDEPPEQRVSRIRAREAVATGARTLATACPFCVNMMSDAMAATPGAENMRVLDIAEILLERRNAGKSAQVNA